MSWIKEYTDTPLGLVVEDQVSFPLASEMSPRLGAPAADIDPGDLLSVNLSRNNEVEGFRRQFQPIAEEPILAEFSAVPESDTHKTLRETRISAPDLVDVFWNGSGHELLKPPGSAQTIEEREVLPVASEQDPSDEQADDQDARDDEDDEPKAESSVNRRR